MVQCVFCSLCCLKVCAVTCLAVYEYSCLQHKHVMSSTELAFSLVVHRSHTLTGLCLPDLCSPARYNILGLARPCLVQWDPNLKRRRCTPKTQTSQRIYDQRQCQWRDAHVAKRSRAAATRGYWKCQTSVSIWSGKPTGNSLCRPTDVSHSRLPCWTY